MSDRIRYIREEEKKYHEACYEQNRLFEEGSWLHKPVKTVLNLLALFDGAEPLSVLDLGCGVGRNSIPIAKAIQEHHRNGQVVCVDLLESALLKLSSYGRQHGVSEWLKPVACDIGDYAIPWKEFDYIVAVSSLEHVRSETEFMKVLGQMNRGTKAKGINCIILNTNIVELDQQSGESLLPLVEINLDTAAAEQLLREAYSGWEVLDTHVKPLAFSIVRNERAILLKSDCLTYVVRKMKSKSGEQ
ncbi:class I SAM-dependent methyltransferase [Paenibacillus sp. LPE1-1-1.1]|uniref:class I SAM-dependent methyltransferase n=1 Tax=Paenibacillus sp. LPE1-1-1.1 TaxID=3135230 RepID=UPI003427EF6E